MPIDPYQPCPCGSGNKIKFCCCSDITAELERLQRMLDGEQFAACLTHLDRLLAKYPGRAALLTIKAQLAARAGKIEDAQEAADALLEKDPANPTALAEIALLKVAESDAVAGVEPLQKALEICDRSMPRRVLETIGALGQALLLEGHIVAARAHFSLHAAIGGDDGSRAMQFLMRLYNAPEVPLLLKQGLALAECPTDAPWRTEFDAAMDLANRGAWAAAREKLSALARQTPDEPALHRNIAALNTYLADEPAAVAAIRAYVALHEKIPLDDAVEAEALAQLIDPASRADRVDLVDLVCPVEDADALMERFLSDRRVMRIPIDPSSFRSEDGPPPKGVFRLLDRPTPETGVGILRGAVPHVIGPMRLFGRQTDREARLEVIFTKTEDWPAKRSTLVDVTGDLAQVPEDGEKMGDVSALQEALSWSWRLPDDTPDDHSAALVAEQRSDVLLERWPSMKLPVLDGRTPTESVGDPIGRIRVLAAILILEQSGRQNHWDFDYNRLRTRLGLPTSDPIDPADVDVAELPPVRLSRLAPEKLTDDQLIGAYRTAAMLSAAEATERLARELIGRPNLDEKVDKAEACGILAQMVKDDEEAIRLIQRAGDIARARRESPAQWLITELTFHLEQGDAAQAQRVLTEIRGRHMQEPGVAEALFEVLVRFGIVRPDGRPVGAAAEPPAAPAAATAEPGKIWTPDSAASSGGGEKPKLWTPGMD